MTSLKDELRRRIRTEHAESPAWFFKTGPGEYGEGDRFLGIRVPDIHAVAKLDDGGSDICGLLMSKWHEERLTIFISLRRDGSTTGIWSIFPPIKLSAHGCSADRAPRSGNWLPQNASGSGGSQSSRRMLSSAPATSKRRFSFPENFLATRRI